MIYDAEKVTALYYCSNTYEDKSDDWGIRAGIQSISKVMCGSVIG
jgi:hypothetical protein